MQECREASERRCGLADLNIVHRQGARAGPVVLSSHYQFQCLSSILEKGGGDGWMSQATAIGRLPNPLNG